MNSEIIIDTQGREDYKNEDSSGNNGFFIDILKEQIHSKDKLLANYANKLFAQEEMWVLINWAIRNINAATDGNALSVFVIEELHKIIKSDLSAICLYDKYSDKLNRLKMLNNNCGSNIEKSINTLIEKHENYIKYVLSQNNDNDYEVIKKFIKNDASTTLHIDPIVTDTGFIAVIYIYKEQQLHENSIFNAIEIISDNYKLAIENINLCTELKKSNVHKTEFIANVSHEFKTPLNAIIGFSELLSNDDVSVDKSQYFLNNIVKNSHHLLRFVEDILDVSQIELNGMNLVYEKYSSKDMIEEVVDILDAAYLAKNITIECNLMDIQVNVDTRRYRQVVYNLLHNAIKFSPENSVVTILTYLDDDKFYFEITDRGIGIADNAKDKIFDMFAQAGDDVLKKQKGHGIGLYICRKIAQRHNGDINVVSTENEGTTFLFHVPMLD